MISLQQVEAAADALSGEAVVVLYFADRKPLDGPAALLDWRLDGQLTRMLLDGEFQGRAGEHVMLQNNGKLKSDWVLFVGGGKWHGLCEETHAALVRHMLTAARQAGFKDVSLSFLLHEETSPEILRNQINMALEAEGENLSSCQFTCESLVPT